MVLDKGGELIVFLPGFGTLVHNIQMNASLKTSIMISFLHWHRKTSEYSVRLTPKLLPRVTREQVD